ncbi:PIN-like domain-containing protein [Aureispira anguillae]|uniref:PIN domain-containing protein n=1 Tax=Aureispira anguillae TaxID=2864201 RepID=A0A916DU23_9BACT|nr:PIN-like domain-containing protein [Aureispira anguillae]BDS12312.1 PIN domain-containing protein [Aureispira anguillae]
MKKFNREEINYYELSEERESKLWEEADFIFDTSSLLDFYAIPEQTREKIYSRIFQKLLDRLWLPFHVQYEFLKNKKSVINRVAKSKYKAVGDTVSALTKSAEGILNKVQDISNKTKDESNHPYIEQSTLHLLKEVTEKYIEQVKKHENSIQSQINNAKDKILNKEPDDVLLMLEQNFQVGREFSFQEILNITREGKHRFEFEIPPGYGDLKAKKGTQVFGDLIIWKQILELSKNRNKPVIFIINDITKGNDWCYQKEKNDILKPREELIKEIRDHSGSDFWMYSLSQFLKIANNRLKSSIHEEELNVVSLENTIPIVLGENIINTYTYTYEEVDSVVFQWIIASFDYKTIVYHDIKKFPEIMMKLPTHLRGVEIKLINNMRDLSIMIDELYDKVMELLGERLFDEIMVILVGNCLKSTYLIYEKVSKFKSSNPNEFINFYVGFINENMEFDIVGHK